MMKIITLLKENIIILNIKFENLIMNINIISRIEYKIKILKMIILKYLYNLKK